MVIRRIGERVAFAVEREPGRKNFRFHRVGIGAVLFVISDLLIFSRFGAMKESAVPGLLIWPTYFAAQALIAWGVVRTLSSSQRVP